MRLTANTSASWSSTSRTPGSMRRSTMAAWILAYTVDSSDCRVACGALTFDFTARMLMGG